MSPRPERRFDGVDLEAFHRGLQGVDRVDLGDHHARAVGAQRVRRTLADVAVTAHDRDLAGQHHVHRALEAVGQRLAAAVEVVELRLGDRVVDVDRRDQQLALFGELVQAVHAGGGLFRHALPVLDDAGEEARALGVDALEQVLDDLFLVVRRRGVDPVRTVLEFEALVDQQGDVAAVVDDQLRTLVAREGQRVERAVPVFLQRLALPREHRRAGLGNCGGGMILGREDVARGPAHVGAEVTQRLDQYRGLDGHVQRAGDAHALERLDRCVLAADRHQARHLVLGDVDFLAAPIGQRDVGDLVVAFGGEGLRYGVHVLLRCLEVRYADGGGDLH
jgi:hypothetical protein